MNRARLLGAGFAAGVANLVFGLAFAHFSGLVPKFQAALREHDLRVIGEPADALPHVLVRLALGLLATLLFAALSARYGRGPRSALVAALFAWCFLYAHSAWAHAHIGLFTPSMAWTLAGSGLVELVCTALVGGWVASGAGFWR